MKMNLNFPKKITHIFFLATIMALFLLSAPRTSFADNATWDSTSLLNTDWNTNGNWTTVPPGGTYPGTPPGTTDIATFNNLSSTTSLFVSSSIAIGAITFTASETHSFTITVDPTFTLTISGTGITNSSGTSQNFVTAVDGSGGEGAIKFTNSATAGSVTIFSNTGSMFSGVFGGFTEFDSTVSGNPTAGSATFLNNVGTVSGANGGFTVFNGLGAGMSSTAGSGYFLNDGAGVSGAGGGFTDFNSFSTAGSGHFTNSAGTVSGGGSGFTRFFNSSTADSATAKVKFSG